MKWPTIKIGEICKQVRGVSYDKNQAQSEPSPGMIPLLRAGNIQAGNLLLDQDLVYVPSACISSHQMLHYGDILIATSSGSLDVVGKAAQVQRDWKGSFGAFCKVVRLVSDQVDVRYLHHFFQSNKYRKTVSSLAAGANINNLRNEHIDNLEIPLPPLEEQRRIAAILDASNRLYKTVEKAAALEHEFSASLFQSIIGDPVVNSKGFPRRKLVELCSASEDIKCGPFGTQLKQHEFRLDGIPLWGIKHVNKRFRLMTSEYLDEETARRLSAYTLVKGDIVMTRKGTVGNCSVYSAHLPVGIMHSDLLRIRLDSSKCLPEFAAYQLHHSPAVKRQIDLISNGAIMAGINVGKLKEIEIIVPDLAVQEYFVSLLRRASLTLWLEFHRSSDLLRELSGSLGRGFFAKSGS